MLPIHIPSLRRPITTKQAIHKGHRFFRFCCGLSGHYFSCYRHIVTNLEHVQSRGKSKPRWRWQSTVVPRFSVARPSQRPRRCYASLPIPRSASQNWATHSCLSTTSRRNTPTMQRLNKYLLKVRVSRNKDHFFTLSLSLFLAVHLSLGYTHVSSFLVIASSCCLPFSTTTPKE